MKIDSIFGESLKLIALDFLRRRCQLREGTSITVLISGNALASGLSTRQAFFAETREIVDCTDQGNAHKQCPKHACHNQSGVAFR
jgi:hypothetical protein